MVNHLHQGWEGVKRILHTGVCLNELKNGVEKGQLKIGDGEVVHEEGSVPELGYESLQLRDDLLLHLPGEVGLQVGHLSEQQREDERLDVFVHRSQHAHDDPVLVTLAHHLSSTSTGHEGVAHGAALGVDLVASLEVGEVDEGLFGFELGLQLSPGFPARRVDLGHVEGEVGDQPSDWFCDSLETPVSEFHSFVSFCKFVNLWVFGNCFSFGFRGNEKNVHVD